MKNEGFMTRKQVADKLGISLSTLYRRLEKAGIVISGNFISPQMFEKIKEAICPLEQK